MPKVMIVEDNRWLRESYGRVLQAEGYATVNAPNALRAIDSIDEQAPDVILLDMLLTKTTGMALLHELQSHEDLAKLPVIIISSVASRFTLSVLRPYGVCAILDKETITPDKMVKAVREALR